MSAAGSFPFPFGEVACEFELTQLKQRYPAFYYSLGRYTREAMDINNYLFIGRRGSGKTSLTKYFHFQETLPNARCIDLNEADIFFLIMEYVSKLMTAAEYQTRVTTIGKATKLWEFVLWSLIFHEYSSLNSEIQGPYFDKRTTDQVAAEQIRTLAAQFRRFVDGNQHQLMDKINEYLFSSEFNVARRNVLQMTSEKPLIIAIDSVEKYDKGDDAMMFTTAGLVQCAADFNIEYVRSGIHVKVFAAAEIFPYLKEQVVLNVAKFVRNPVYLHWRPRDLVHLISWRFWKYLTSTPQYAADAPRDVDWADFDEVLKRLWYPYFGEELVNGNQMEERTFPYLLRHTQMRPRQLVHLCNAIARQSQAEGRGIQFWRVDIPSVVRSIEIAMADEVINSYSLIYPQIPAVVSALDDLPITFMANELDKVAKTTRHVWPRGEYSLEAFRMLVVELGIVGKVRHRDNNGRYIHGDFEYAVPDRLNLDSNDECVVHPMFYRKLHTRCLEPVIVFPFPNHSDFHFDVERWMIPSRGELKPYAPANNGPLSRLTGAQFDLLHKAILDAFDEPSLKRLVRVKLEEELKSVADGRDFQEVVFELIAWANRTRRVKGLVLGALEVNPWNEMLQKAAKELRIY